MSHVFRPTWHPRPPIPWLAPFAGGSPPVTGALGYWADDSTIAANPSHPNWPRSGAVWQFTGVAGTSVPDDSGSANAGVLGGSAAWTRDAYGPAISFPGSSSSDNVTVASPTTANAAGKQITVAATVTSASASQDGGVIDKTIGGNTNTQFLMFLEGGVPKFRVCDNPGGSSTSVGAGDQYTAVADAAIGTTRPYRLVGVYDGASVKLYVDGVLQSTAPAATFSVVAGSGSVLIGTLGSTLYPFNGKIGDVRIDASAWTLAQIHLDASDPFGPFRAPANWWEPLVIRQADIDATHAAWRRPVRPYRPEPQPPRAPRGFATVFQATVSSDSPPEGYRVHRFRSDLFEQASEIRPRASHAWLFGDAPITDDPPIRTVRYPAFAYLPPEPVTLPPRPAWLFEAPTTYLDVLEAIQGYWAGQPSLAAEFHRGRLYLQEAEEGSKLPYITIFQVSSAIEYTTGTWIETTVVQFSIHAATAKRCRDLYRLLIAAFDRAVLTVEGEPVMLCERQNSLLFLADSKGPDGKDLWMQTADYLIMTSGEA